MSCIVRACKVSKQQGKSLFTLPKKNQKRKKWLLALRRPDLIDVVRDLRVCEDHFPADCLRKSTGKSTRKYLLPRASPSLPPLDEPQQAVSSPVHPKEESKLFCGGESSTASEAGTKSAAVGGRRTRKQVFWAYVEKDRRDEGEKKVDGGESSAMPMVFNGTRPSDAVRSSCVDIGTENVRRWMVLKAEYGYVSDGEFANFLLDHLVEHSDPSTSLLSRPTNTSANISDSDNVYNGPSDSKSSPIDIKLSVAASDGPVVAADDDDGEDAENDGDDEDEAMSEDERDCESSDEVQDDDSEFVADSDLSYGEDTPEESDESMSEYEKDVEWTPAGLCETQLTHPSVVEADEEDPMHGLKRTRCRMNAASIPKSSRKSSSPAEECSGEKVKRRQAICIDCNQKHDHGECPLTRPDTVISDSPVDKDGVQRSMAESSLPKMLKLVTVDASHGPCVFALEKISKQTQFGPLIGERIKEPDIREDVDLKHVWEVFGGNCKLYVDTSNENTSNWLRYMRPAKLKSRVNVTVIVKEDELFFVTTKDITAGAELFYWVEDPTWSWSKTMPVKMNCLVCNKRFTHPLYYRMHCVIFHDHSVGFGLRKFRCKVCSVTVLGREALRQHASEMHGGKGAYQCEFCKKVTTLLLLL